MCTISKRIRSKYSQIAIDEAKTIVELTTLLTFGSCPRKRSFAQTFHPFAGCRQMFTQLVQELVFNTLAARAAHARRTNIVVEGVGKTSKTDSNGFPILSVSTLCLSPLSRICARSSVLSCRVPV